MILTRKKIQIDQQKGRLSEEEIKRIVEEAEKYKSADADVAKKIQSKNDLESYTYQIRNTLDDPKFKEQIKEDDRTKVEKAVKDTVDWIDHNPNAELDEFEHKKKEIEELWKPIITNIYGSTGMPGGGMPGGGMPGGMPNMGNFGGGGGPSGPSGGPQIDEVD
jgi:L1 cell adhesion molecule like protein